VARFERAEKSLFEISALESILKYSAPEAETAKLLKETIFGYFFNSRMLKTK
jgi:hypothetical protein